MARKTLEDGRTVVDWETGDPEGDRKYLMAAYRDFITEIIEGIDDSENEYDALESVMDSIKKWNVSTDNQVDDFPRIWIERPKNK